MKLDLGYWTSKIDVPEDSDYAAISDAFHSDERESNGFTSEEKTLLAEVLLAHTRICPDEDDFVKMYKICTKFDRFFAVNPLFYSDHAGDIKTWRYSFRGFMKAVPDKFVREAVTAIYARLGIQIDETDLMRIGASSNIYSMFIQFIKNEAAGRIIYADAKEDLKQFADVIYLNTYLLFDKLGLEGRDVYEAFASIGSISRNISTYRFVGLSPAEQLKYEEAIRRSKGRCYPTWYEMATVLEA